MIIRKVSDMQFKLKMLLRVYAESTNPSTPIVSSTPSSHTGGSGSRIGNRKRKFDYLAEFDENDSKYSSGSGKSILDTYLEDSKIERKVDLDVLESWKTNQKKYGELSRLAGAVLSVQLTTVASELTFSVRGQEEEEEFIGSNVDRSSTKSVRLFPRHK